MSDTTFHYLFKTDVGKRFYCKVIEELLEIDLSNYHILDGDLSSGGSGKDFRVDTLLVSEDGKHIVNVEMNKSDYYKLNRNQYYLHRIAGGVPGHKTDYRELSKYKIEQINFNNFKHEDENIMCSTYKLVDSEHHLTLDNFKIHHIYLPTCKKLCYNELKEILLFTSESYEEMRKIAGEDKELNMLVDKIEQLNRDKYFGGIYRIQDEIDMWKRTAERDKREAIEEGREEGRAEGEKQKNLENARRMKEEKLSADLIQKITGLSIEKIESL